MKNTLMMFYLVVGISLCGWYTVAAAYKWKSPDFGIIKGLSEGSSGGGYYGGRSYGGAWGGGK